MAVDINKFPTDTGTGLFNNPRISKSYPTLVSDLIQTEGTNLDNDSICYATSSSKRDVSAMCAVTHLIFDFDYSEENNVTCYLKKFKKSKYPKAGIMMYKRNTFRTAGFARFGTETTGWHNRDYKPYCIEEREKGYGVLGNSSAVQNDVSFITGFDWFYVFGKLVINLMPYNSVDNRFDISGGEYPPSITSVDYDTYMSTYANDPNYIAVGAELQVRLNNNLINNISAAPWCGYKSPDYIIGELDPYPESTSMPATSHRIFDITDMEHPALFFDSGMNRQPAGYRFSMGAGVSTFPIVDPLFISWVVKYANGFPWNTNTYIYTAAAIRGGDKSFTIEESTAYDTSHSSIAQRSSNCYYSKVVIDNILKAAASYGIIFTTDNSIPTNQNMNTKANMLTYGRTHKGKIFVPIPDSNGCYSGDYMDLDDFIENGEGKSPFWPKTDTDLANTRTNPNSSFDKAKGGGGEGSEDTDIDETELNDVKLNTIGVFNRCYAVSLNDMKDLADYIYNADDSIVEAVLKGVKFMGDTPSNALISLVQTPFNIPDLVGGGTLSYIKLGRQTTTVQGLILPTSMTSVIDMGSLTIPYPHSMDENTTTPCFLDFEPYTIVSMYVPFVGVLELSAKEVIGKTLNVRLIIDWQSNTTCAAVFIGGIMVTYRMGVINTAIEMTAADRAVNVSQIASGILNIAHSTVGAVGGAKQMAGSAIMAAATGGASGAGGMSGGQNSVIDNAFGIAHGALQVYDGIAQPTIYKEIGTPTSACGQFLPPFAYVMISTVDSLQNEVYGNSTGFACNQTDYLGAFEGFTVCSGFKSRIARTANENQLINAALAAGVIM